MCCIAMRVMQRLIAWFLDHSEVPRARWPVASVFALALLRRRLLLPLALLVLYTRIKAVQYLFRCLAER
jgi:hypothetical protein